MMKGLRTFLYELKYAFLQMKRHIMLCFSAISAIGITLLLIGSILIITGYVLMSGEGSTPAAYNPDIFSRLRICIAPIICLLGYLLNVVGIIYITKKNN